MDERKMLIFRSVADLRSFSHAAEALHLSQPTVSQVVQGLEEQLGVRLFDRSSKHVALTAAGKELYGHVASLLQQFAEVRRAVLQAAGAVRGPLTIGASLTIGEYVLPQVLAKFVRAYPGVEVRMQIENTEQVLGSLRSGGIDVGFVEGRLEAPDLIQVRFLEDELVMVAPSDHPWKERIRIPVADVAAERLILREQGSGTRQIFAEHMAAAGIPLENVRVSSELTSTEAIKGAVAAGMGVAALSQWAIGKEVKLGSIIWRRVEGLRMTRLFQVVYPRGRSLLPAAGALLSLVETEQFEAHQVERLGLAARR